MSRDGLNELNENGGVVYRGLLLRGAHHVVDFLRISLPTQMLIGEFLHEAFEAQKNLAPSKNIQQTWLGFPIIGTAAMLSVVVKTMNYRYSEKNPDHYLAAEDYLFALFECSRLYFAIQICGISRMSPGWFIATSAVGLPTLAALFFKFTSPESSDQFTYPWSAYFNPPKYLFATVAEQRLNALKCAKIAFFSVSTFLWAINRELNGETVSLARWQIGLIFLFLSVALKIGYESTMHPKFFQGFFAFLKLLETTALIYAAISGILLMAIAYHCVDGMLCINSDTRELLSYACAAIALPLGLYSAALARVRFEENHESNEKIITACENAIATFHAKKTAIAEGCGTAFQKMGDGISNGFQFFKNKMPACCTSRGISRDNNENGYHVIC